VHFAVLDGLRGIAVLTVMLLHFTLFVPANSGEHMLESALAAGWVGVDLFFVLSGFLITGILLDTRETPGFFRNFYARRTLRIFPLYYAFLFVLFLVLPAISEGYAAEHATVDRRWWFWSYLGNVLMALQGWDGMPGHTTHLWSLAVEEQFYLLWPLLIFLVPRRHAGRLAIATILFAWGMRVILALNGEPVGAYVHTFARMDTLAAGALVAIAQRGIGPVSFAMLIKFFAVSGGFLLVGASAWNASQGQWQQWVALDPEMQILGYLGLALGFAALVGHLVHSDSASRLVFHIDRPTLRTLGKYSYALYIVHIPIRNAMKSLVADTGGLPAVGGSQLPAQLAFTLTGIAISFAIALTSWHMFEKHFLPLKRHFE